MLTTGDEGDPPTAISNSWNDYIGGLHAHDCASSRRSADRAETGRGRNIDLAPVRGERGHARTAADGRGGHRDSAPARGNRSSQRGAAGRYPCAGEDEWCAVSVETDAQWRGLARVIGQPRWSATRGSPPPSAAFATTTRSTQPSRPGRGALAARGRERLQAAGVPAERMRRADDFVDAADSGHVYRPSPATGPTAADAHAPVHVQPQRRDPAQRRVQARRAHPRGAARLAAVGRRRDHRARRAAGAGVGPALAGGDRRARQVSTVRRATAAPRRE